MKKVFVGISGGVDSSVTAYLLKAAGYDVQGIFVKTWSPEWLPCTWVDEKRDAMRVCAALDIPFHFLDAEIAYRDGVAAYMIDEYKAGRTPNPDVLCNRVIKFGVMWEYARAHGADILATGHYARAENGMLMQGVDMAKDQSYFLWMLTHDDLAHTLFPIGGMSKSEVRAIAKKAGLMTAAKKDSQGICFLGSVDMRDFLAHYLSLESGGRVINTQGEVIGEHDGVQLYTIGERHGFRIHATMPDQKPYYVVAKDVEHNTLTVSHERLPETSGAGQRITLREVNWLTAAKENHVYRAQIRYHGEYLSCHVIDETTVQFDRALPIPLGQSLVVYDGEQVIGGGIIDKIDTL